MEDEVLDEVEEDVVDDSNSGEPAVEETNNGSEATTDASAQSGSDETAAVEEEENEEDDQADDGSETQADSGSGAEGTQESTEDNEDETINNNESQQQIVQVAQTTTSILAQTASTNTEDKSAVYFKRVPTSGEIAPEVKIIANGFTEIVSIGSFGGFIYVADSDLGFYAIQVDTQAEEFSEPRKMEITQGENSTTAPKPTTMVVFTLGGVALFMNASAALVISLGLMSLF